MPDLPAEITLGLIGLAAAILTVGALLVRAYGKLVQSNIELTAAKREHEKTEVSNQSRLEALALQMTENNAKQNAALQDTVTKLTSEFSRQIGEVNGLLKGEKEARKVLEGKFEIISEQKVQTAQQLFSAREALARTERERDQLKLDVARMSAELADLPKLREEIETYRKQVEGHTAEIKRQAAEIMELKERQEKRHNQINEWQASEMERKAELDIMTAKYNRSATEAAKAKLEASAAREALAKANEIIMKKDAELNRLAPLIAASDLEPLLPLPPTEIGPVNAPA